ncbi:hypothetical protein Tco_0305506, partial [Tanacetum coccineum]
MQVGIHLTIGDPGCYPTNAKTYFDLQPHLNGETVNQNKWRRQDSGELGEGWAVEGFLLTIRSYIFLQSSTKISDNNLILCEAEMKAIQDAITAGTIPPKTGRQILAEVTRSTNRAHIAGVGRNLAGMGNLDSEEQRKAFESQQNALKKFVDFFNRQQGTPSSQFEIPDLYTPQVFPGSISTPGGPSSSSPAPSSTPLDLGNCYTPTFNPETSQSDEQEDNGSDDGNHEYDVDIYDDEQGLS